MSDDKNKAEYFRPYGQERRAGLAWLMWSLVVLAVVSVLAATGGLLFRSYYAPAQEEIRRNTILQSRAYNEGMIRELSRLRIQLEQAKTDGERDAIKAMVRHEVGAVDISILPAELRDFVNSVR